MDCLPALCTINVVAPLVMPALQPLSNVLSEHVLAYYYLLVCYCTLSSILDQCDDQRQFWSNCCAAWHLFCQRPETRSIVAEVVAVDNVHLKLVSVSLQGAGVKRDPKSLWNEYIKP